ncbi:Glycosyl transferase, family 14-containing protein [Strongyloides ratti]|uniref:Glycosyl transferase, family 14-containing protein n=1 Tax=Strongyloides ratti TaxID=34506 RepID=A0A090LFC5_STRRB|nr:Glycosyl transferase, family 14-containing protein [Strongyloides ratti]CEF68496.1 Glycosyl transferase, family 14-containing protein [Strongyloides ratti]
MYIKKDTSIYDSNSNYKNSFNKGNILKGKNFTIIKRFKLFPIHLSIALNLILFAFLIGQFIYYDYQYQLTQINEELKNKIYDVSIQDILYYSPVVNKEIPLLWKHPIVSNINCYAILNEDDIYIKNEAKNLRKLKNLQNTFPTSCHDIKRRGYYPDKPLSQEEADFPLAYVRTIYTDYLTLEYQFLLSYAPQNHYCFIIDKKQSGDFHSKIFALSNCFKNVYIISNQYNMDSNGNDINHANFRCMKYLNSKSYKYLIVLNNDDMPLKTNREMIEILKIYNGTIDIDYDDPKPYLNGRIDLSLNWTLDHLNIFKKDDKRNLDKEILASEIKFQKGFVEIAYPKKTVDYLVNVLNITTFLNQLNNMKLYANDEMSFQSLLSNKFLDIPGGIDSECFEKDNIYHDTYMTRYTKWYNETNCDKNETRHWICLQTIKTLSTIKKLPHFFVNKFKAETDFGGLTCWAEYLYNRTYFQKYIPINAKFYENLPLVQYQKLKSQIEDRKNLCDTVRNKYYSN